MKKKKNTYRSAIFFFSEEQFALAERTKRIFQQSLNEHGLGDITTEITRATEFYYAEEHHQQYLYNDKFRHFSRENSNICLDLSRL